MKRLVAASFAVLSLGGAAAMTDALTGRFGGDQVALDVGAEGGRLTLGCGAGLIDGPLIPDADGNFAANGSFELWQGGPARGDGLAPAAKARFHGKLTGVAMTLTVAPAHGKPITWQLSRDRHTKVIRCA